MGRPRRVSEPHAGGGWTTRVADAPPPEVRVGRACVPVDHENLDRFGWSERTDEGRRRVVRSALRFAAEIGVQVVVPPAETPPGLPEGAVVVSQPPPEAFRSNGDWAADLMKRVARHYLADAREGPRAVESLLFYGLTGRTSADYAGALAQGLGHLHDQLQAPAAPTGRPWLPAGAAGGDHAALRAALVEHVALAGDVWGPPQSAYACARVLTRAHTERAGSPLALDSARSELQPLSPSPYGDTLGGWFAWHLAETRPRFREFDPGELAADCNEWLAARAAEDLLDKADLRGVVDGVPGRVSSGPVREALEALPVPPDDAAVYGMLVGDQAAGWNRHPLNRPRPQFDPVVGVEPAAFRELDSRRRGDTVVLEDRILGLCARSGVAVKLHDSDRVRSFHAPSLSRGGLAAHVAHPIPERFGSTEDWGRSLLSTVALAVQTHPRLYDHARLDRLFGKDPAEGVRMFDGATRVLCDRYGLDRSGVVSRARAFEAKPVGDWAGVSALDEIEDRTGVPAARFEVARRAFWTAFGDACVREGVARGWADAAIATADHDYVGLGGSAVRPSRTFRWRSVTATGSSISLSTVPGVRFGRPAPSSARWRTSWRIDSCPTSARRGRVWISISVTARVPARSSAGSPTRTGRPTRCSPRSRPVSRWAGTATTRRFSRSSASARKPSPSSFWIRPARGARIGWTTSRTRDRRSPGGNWSAPAPGRRAR